MRTRQVLALAGLLTCAVTVGAQPELIDDFEALETWIVAPSDGVRATITPAEGPSGKCLRLDFDFERGAGFCVLRRAFERDLPRNYRFTFALRGDAPPNNLEFKLLDASGENVWWVNRRAFEFPTEWQTIRYKARHLSFAWGPSGGAPLTRLSAIEFAIASATGGKGSVYFDELTFEPLPEVSAAAEPPIVQFSTRAGTPDVPPTLAPDGRVDWTWAPGDPAPTLTLDCHGVREFGGVALEWAPEAHATDCEILLSPDLQRWESAAKIAGGNGGRDYIPIAGAEARGIRLQFPTASRNRPVTLRSLRLLPPACGESANELYSFIARESPRGWYPRYFLGEQSYWTVLGAPGDDYEALMNTDGAIELEKLGFSIEPFIALGGELRTWADCETSALVAPASGVPVARSAWRSADLNLTITAFVAADTNPPEVLIRHELTYAGQTPAEATLYLALRPFQVLPPWQALNLTGGAGRLAHIKHDGGSGQSAVHLDGRTLRFSTESAFGATEFARGDIIEHLATSLPAAASITDPQRLASAALAFPVTLAPDQPRSSVITAMRLDAGSPRGTARSPEQAVGPAEFERRLVKALDFWNAQLSRTDLRLPDDAAPLVDTWRATQAYILINADGPAIQPGSRTYERSWIRDGALTSTALLHTGHPEQVKAFLDWYGPYQFDNGKVPCVVDRRGPDPVPEHDSTGQYIYLLHKYYRMTGDRDMLARHLPRVIAGVDYLESLRDQRMTPEYRDGPPEKRACYGLVPESISHEGYSAKPMHSYWDSFFVLRGFKDAASIAALLGRTELEQRFARLRDEYRRAVHDSLKLALELKQIDYIPGCVELGDFDATSTAIALFPCDEADYLPRAAVQRTFDKYWEFVCDRRDGRLAWDNYTPYELRVLGAFIRLGQPERAHAALEFFMQDQRPRAWHHWAEVVWRDPRTPKFIGDMPHTWCGTEFLNSFRSMFVYERERDASLVVGGGVKPEWLRSPGVAISNWPTEYGPLSYELWRDGDQLHLRLNMPLRDWPPGGLVIAAPWDAAFAPNAARELPVSDPGTDFEWKLQPRR